MCSTKFLNNNKTDCIFAYFFRGPPRLVRLGEYDRSRQSDNAAVVDIDVERAIPHPAYKKTEKYNDIGLIQMARSVEFNQYIRPACLPEMYSTGTEKAIATGWGRTDYRSQGSEILMKVVLELYSDDECRQLYYAESHSSQLKNGIDVQTQFCAGSRIAKKDVCQVSEHMKTTQMPTTTKIIIVSLAFAGRLGRSTSTRSSVQYVHLHHSWRNIVRKAVQ